MEIQVRHFGVFLNIVMNVFMCTALCSRSGTQISFFFTVKAEEEPTTTFPDKHNSLELAKSRLFITTVFENKQKCLISDTITYFILLLSLIDINIIS